jgi:hypothetical protein
VRWVHGKNDATTREKKGKCIMRSGPLEPRETSHVFYRAKHIAENWFRQARAPKVLVEVSISITPYYFIKILRVLLSTTVGVSAMTSTERITLRSVPYRTLYDS